MRSRVTTFGTPSENIGAPRHLAGDNGEPRHLMGSNSACPTDCQSGLAMQQREFSIWHRVLLRTWTDWTAASARSVDRTGPPIGVSQKPKNGNISNISRRLSAFSPQSCAILESGDRLTIRKSPQLAGVYAICDSTISSCRTG